MGSFLNEWHAKAKEACICQIEALIFFSFGKFAIFDHANLAIFFSDHADFFLGIFAQDCF